MDTCAQAENSNNTETTWWADFIHARVHNKTNAKVTEVNIVHLFNYWVSLTPPHATWNETNDKISAFNMTALPIYWERIWQTLIFQAEPPSWSWFTTTELTTLISPSPHADFPTIFCLSQKVYITLVFVLLFPKNNKFEKRKHLWILCFSFNACIVCL